MVKKYYVCINIKNYYPKMKNIKAKISLFTAIIACSAAAQTSNYVPLVREGVKWTYNVQTDVDGVRYTRNVAEWFRGDTVIGGKTYKKLYRQEPHNVSCDTLRPVGCAREEGKVVHAIIFDYLQSSSLNITPGKEFKLYDFSNPYIDCSRNLSLKSESEEVIGSVSRKVYSFGVPYGATGEYIKLVEGIGCVSNADLSAGELLDPSSMKSFEKAMLCCVEENGVDVYHGPGYGNASGISCSGILYEVSDNSSHTVAAVGYAKTGAEVAGAVGMPDTVQLGSVHYPERHTFSVSAVRKRSFENFNAAQMVLLGNNVSVVGDSAFIGSAVSRMVLPDKVESVGKSAFENCTGLERVTLPESLATIGLNAFKGTALKAIYNCSATPKDVPADAFAGIDKGTCHLYVPQGSLNSYKAAPVWKEFIVEEGTDAVPLVREGVKWKYRVNRFISGSYIAEYTLNEEFRGDTVINGITYKKLYVTPYEALDVATEKPVAFMRQDGRAVYGLYADEFPAQSYVIDVGNGKSMFYNFANPTAQNIVVDNTCLTTIGGQECLTYESGACTRIIEGYGIDGYMAGDLYNPGIAVPTTWGNERILTLNTIEENATEIYRGAAYSAKPLWINVNGVCYKKGSAQADCLAVYSDDSICELEGHQVKIAPSFSIEGHPFAVTEIADDAFAGKAGVDYLEIPVSVTSVGARAFSGTGLKNIYNRSAVPQQVGNGAFSGVDKAACKLYVPAGSVEAYKAAPVWKEFFVAGEAAGIDTAVAPAKTVDRIEYVSPTGVVGSTPVQGINIVITRYTDGSRTVSKQLR